MESPSIDTCTAAELAHFLYTSRFEKDEGKASKFLQEALQSLSQQSPSKDGVSNNPQSSKPTEAIIGKPVTKPCDISIATPRIGKCQLTVHQHGLCFVKVPTNGSSAPEQRWIVQGQQTASQSTLSHVVIFPKPEDCRRPLTTKQASNKPRTADLVLLCFDAPRYDLPNTKKGIEQICFALPFDKTKRGALGPVRQTSTDDQEDDNTNGTANATMSWKSMIIDSLQLSLSSQVSHIARPIESPKPNDGATESSPPFEFSSVQPPNTSTTTGNLPCIKCHSGVQDGMLFPMISGLLFYKPPRFLPRQSLASIACGRGSGGVSSSRYVDLVIELQSKEVSDEDAPPPVVVEFSNISRDEVGVLNEYIHGSLVPAMQRDVDKSDDTKAAAAVGIEAVDDDNSDVATDAISDEEDEAFDHKSDHKDSDDDDDDDDGGDNNDTDDEDDVIVIGSEGGDDDFAVVEDDFAKELLAKKKKSSNTDDSETESEGDEPNRRVSKRLRRE